ncbi:dolichyl-phosphate-mannose--protein mannosyltransferase [Corynebacterium sp. ES2794-CONJ1]|uniref:dolichyl-phosphate-mannose--protein mannosyltransferase n=1 Tax=Corynebacterium sp. ES2794-CONJ1 TaxID=2980553 RepID=UPI00398837FE
MQLRRVSQYLSTRDRSTSNIKTVNLVKKPPNHEYPRHIWTLGDTLSTMVVFICAALLRFVNLGSLSDQETPVFDEKHYVPQAWDMVETWMNPILGGIESNPGYGLVVHPPLGKQLIALGEMLYGYTPFGWRAVGALLGALTITLIMAITRQLTRSTGLATTAGVIALSDGFLLVISRFALLDVFQTFFITAASWAIIRDWLQVSARYEDRHESLYGPPIGFRWWRFACGVFLGLALSVKWSGLYYMAFFGILSVILDYRTRARSGTLSPFVGTLMRDSWRAFTHLVILPVALYIWSWRAWFASETSIYHHVASDGTLGDDSFIKLLPEGLAGWTYYHSEVLKFHASLTTSAGHQHPFESKPWEWLVGIKPILYFSQTDIPCGPTACRRMLYLFGTPALWWLVIPVIIAALWLVLIKKDWVLVIPLWTFAAGFIPWLIGYDRQMYFFYAAPLIPMVIVMLTYLLGKIIHRRPRGGTVIVSIYLGILIAQFFYFMPLFFGFILPDSAYDALAWIPAWR